MRIVLTITYDGTNYCGWQRQKNGLSVQHVLETAIKNLIGNAVTITASGRTDAGVHAEMQVVHFDADTKIPPEKFYLALNQYLPCDIKATSSRVAEEGFHARYSAKRKTYRYAFYASEVTLPLIDRYATRIDGDMPNLKKAQEVLDLFVGTHDFKAFSTTGSKVKTTVRTIYSATAVTDGNKFIIGITGNGFLYNMVRIIAGTVLSFCRGKVTMDEVSSALLTGKRLRAFTTAPAQGLTLESVEYAEYDTANQS